MYRIPVGLLFLLVLLPLTAEGRFRRSALPISIRMVATVGAAPQGTRPEFVWKVTARGDKKYIVNVLNLVVLSGTALAGDIDSAVSPYPSQFQLAGPTELLERITNAPQGQPLVIRSYVRIDSTTRALIVSSVESGSIEDTAPAS